MRAQRGTVAALLLVAAVAGCTEVSTDPQVPLSLQFDSLPALAIVVGDTMRGGDLLPARVAVRAFNSNGSTVSDSQIKLVGIDTISTKAFSVIGGLQLLGKVEAAAVRVVAQAGSLQSQTQTFAVVPRPTSLVKGDTIRDSIVYDFTDSTTRFSDVKASILHKGGDSAAVPLNGLRVAFRVASFSTTILDSVRLISPSGGRNIASAIIASNVAAVRVKAYPKQGATGTGTIVVEATYSAFGAPIPGSPLQIPVRLVQFSLTP